MSTENEAVFIITTRMSGGTFVARVKNQGLTASCTESDAGAARAVAKKFVEARGWQQISLRASSGVWLLTVNTEKPS